MDNWYYIKNQKSTGPLSEAEFIELMDQGVIQAQTLVWNPNLSYNWAEFSSLPVYSSLQKQVSEFGAPVVPETLFDQKSDQDLCPCDECSRLFRRSELIQRENFLLCKACNLHFDRQYLNQLKSMRAPRCAECGKEAWSKELFPCGDLLVCADCRPLYFWYYKDQENSIGPFKEEKFLELAEKGVIHSQTQVWNPRMHYGYVKYENLRPEDFTQKRVSSSHGHTVEPKLAENEGRCRECGKVFLRVEMISFNHLFVCANCKPVFLQKLKEGVYKEEPMPVVAEMRYAGFWVRFAASIIDTILLYMANIPIGFLSPFMIERWKTSPSYFFIIQGNFMLFGIIISAAYEILLIGKYGATVGKMVFHLRVVTADRKQLTYLQSLGRHFAKFLSSIICGIGYIMAAFDNEKRGLHDQICNTRVIKK